jgi:hypothetical protein
MLAAFSVPVARSRLCAWVRGPSAGLPWAAVLSLLPSRGYKSHRVSLRKRLGQHLLKNPDVVRHIVDAAGVTESDLVLEIGPGTGNMTIPLLQRAKGVFAVELDPSMHDAVTLRARSLYVNGRPRPASDGRRPLWSDDCGT